MPTTRKNDFTILDYSGFFELVPRVNTLVSSMDLFRPHYGVSTIAHIERITEKVDLIPARRRGGDRNYATSEDAKTRNFNIPFFPLDRQISPLDVQNLRAYGTADSPKTVQQEVARVMERLKRFHAQLREKAFMEAIQGRSWSPEDTNSQYDYYSEWGVTQQLSPVDFTDAAVDPGTVIEERARAHIIDNAFDNGASYRLIALCSRKWFSALIAHPLVQNAFANYPSTQEPLRNRLGGNSINRYFEYKGVLYIEDISGYIADGEAYIMPMGIDMFSIHYAPAHSIEFANTTAREMYIWYKESAYHKESKIETETSFIAVNTRPELVVKSVGTFPA